MKRPRANAGSVTVAVIVGLSLLTAALGGLFGVKSRQSAVQTIQQENLKVEVLQKQVEGLTNYLERTLEQLGGVSNAVGGKQYFLSGSGISATQTTIPLTKFEIAGGTQKLTMADFGELGCGTVEPGHATRQEFISFTGVTQNDDGSATLTGVARGLSPIPDYAASTTLQDTHGGGSSFVISNSPPCFYEGYANLTTSENVQRAWNFFVLPTATSTATSSNQFATRAYADNLVNQGAATSTEINGGIVELGTISEAASASSSVEIALTDKPRVLQTKDASSSPISVGPNGKHYVVVTQASSTIHSDFIDRTASSSFIGGLLINAASVDASTTITSSAIGTTTVANNLNIKAASSTSEKLWLNGVGLSVNPEPLSGIYASGTVPTLNANGNITFEHPEWEFLGESISSGATTTIFATTTLPKRRELMLKIFTPGFNSASGIGLRFNSDGERNYGWQATTTMFGEGGSSNSIYKQGNVQSLDLIDVDPFATTTPLWFTVRINNESDSTRKVIEWSGYSIGTGTEPPVPFSGSGIWNNTNSQITSMYIFTCKGNTAFCPAGSTQTFNSGTRITIYGSRY